MIDLCLSSNASLDYLLRRGRGGEGREGGEGRKGGAVREGGAVRDPSISN